MKYLMVVVVMLFSVGAYAEETVAEAVGETARKVQDGVVEGVEGIGDFIKGAVEDVAEGAQKAAKKASTTAEEFVDDVKEGYENAGNDS